MLVRLTGLDEAILICDDVGVNLFVSRALVGVKRPSFPSTGESASEPLSLLPPEGLLLRNAFRIRDDLERLWLGLFSISLDVRIPPPNNRGGAPIGKKR